MRALRNSLAVKEHVPAYVIFNDATLKDMCSRLPCTENEFSGITGVGQKKLDLYGRQFIELIQRYCDNANNKDGSSTGGYDRAGNSNFHPGDEVFHTIFGDGTVISAVKSGKVLIYEVKFRDGEIKKLNSDFAGLRKAK